MTTWKRFSKQLNSKQKPCLNRLKTNATRKRYVGQKEGKIANSTASVSLKMTTKRHDTLKTKELLSVSAFSNPRSIEAHQIGSCVRSFVIFFFHICRFNHRFFRLFVRQFTSSALLRFDSQLQRYFFSRRFLSRQESSSVHRGKLFAKWQGTNKSHASYSETEGSVHSDEEYSAALATTSSITQKFPL